MNMIKAMMQEPKETPSDCVLDTRDYTDLLMVIDTLLNRTLKQATTVEGPELKFFLGYRDGVIFVRDLLENFYQVHKKHKANDYFDTTIDIKELM